MKEYPCWTSARGLPVYRSVGGPTFAAVMNGLAVIKPARPVSWTRFVAHEGIHYFPITLDLDAFELNDPEMTSSDTTCPCGEALWADTVGELVREIRKHCDSAHPGAFREMTE